MKSDAASGCVLPLAQSIITAVFIGLLAYSAGLWWNVITWRMALTIGAGAGVFMWLAGLRRWQHAAYPELLPPALQMQEPATEPTEPARVRLELTREDGRQVQMIDLPASLEQLTALARGLLTGATLSEAHWTGAGGVFTRSEFSALRSELIRRGLAAWNSPGTPARGAALTAPGRAAMRHFASMTTDAASPPLPGALRRR